MVEGGLKLGAHGSSSSWVFWRLLVDSQCGYTGDFSLMVHLALWCPNKPWWLMWPWHLCQGVSTFAVVLLTPEKWPELHANSLFREVEIIIILSLGVKKNRPWTPCFQVFNISVEIVIFLLIIKNNYILRLNSFFLVKMSRLCVQWALFNVPLVVLKHYFGWRWMRKNYFASFLMLDFMAFSERDKTWLLFWVTGVGDKTYE